MITVDKLLTCTFIQTGIGVAFPLDTLKTKSQVLAQQGTTASLSLNGKETMSMNVGQMNMFQLIKYIFEMEGLSGEFRLTLFNKVK